MTSQPTAVIQRGGFKVREVARTLGVTDNTIYGLIYDGTISPLRIGRSVRIPRSELDRLGYPIPTLEAPGTSGRDAA
jgi:excisionase family DNA binding protein